jgi:hypothetical protein
VQGWCGDDAVGTADDKAGRPGRQWARSRCHRRHGTDGRAGYMTASLKRHERQLTAWPGNARSSR